MSKKTDNFIVLCILLFVLISIPFGMFAIPTWRVWSQEMAGKAKLREAEWSRQIIEQEAKARASARSMLSKADADAEVTLARAQAEANEIIADGLGGPDGYLRWKWIQAIESTNNQIIYIPTEANLPLLEAGHR